MLRPIAFWNIPFGRLPGVVLAGALLGACGPAVTPTATPIAGDAKAGEQLFRQGTATAPACITCHSLEPDVALVGPSLAGVASHAAEIIRLADYTGQATTVEAYLRESIIQPDAYVSHGFAPGLMYQAYGQELSEQQVNDLVAFMLTLKGEH
jgi:nitric oxide reductase subunit C